MPLAFIRTPFAENRNFGPGFVFLTPTTTQVKESTKAAVARNPDVDWMVRMFVERGGGYAGVDATIRAALRSAMVIPAHGGALVAAGKATLRAIVLTQAQGALVHRIFYDDASGRWRRGRWHIEAGASSGKSFIAVHLAAHWATTVGAKSEVRGARKTVLNGN